MREEMQIVFLLPPFTRGAGGDKNFGKNKYLCLHWNAPHKSHPFTHSIPQDLGKLSICRVRYAPSNAPSTIGS
ncbi:MAG TPA: hypothetical protein DDW51_24875, partial [Cyanobacteria bacterium UBA11367]|nr:hypothetical protein [Cyanobacteria bacterium UBA11367]